MFFEVNKKSKTSYVHIKNALKKVWIFIEKPYLSNLFSVEILLAIYHFSVDVMVIFLSFSGKQIADEVLLKLSEID